MIVDIEKLSFSKPRGFIVFDGVNGAGKSTLINSVIQYLKENKVEFLSTREPGGSKLGKDLRKIILECEEKHDPLAEVFLFAADRSEHVKKTILPALKQNKVVISDRYYYSTVAFQGYGRGLNTDLMYKINQIAIDGIFLDLVIILDLSPEEVLKRAKLRDGNGDCKDCFEKEELDFHHRLRNGFLEIAKNYPEKFLVIDASLTKEEVAKIAITAIRKLIQVL